jgi:arabinoxylan arabinofuranohydrolase
MWKKCSLFLLVLAFVSICISEMPASAASSTITKHIGNSNNEI